MELKEIIERMDILRNELDSLRPIPEDRLNRLNQKLRLDWNYHSNSLEGNTLTASETRAFLLHNITANGKPFRDYIEMRGHNDALKKLESIIHHDLKITEKLIKEFHKIILVEPYDSKAEIKPGEYKTLPNYLYSQTGERIDFEPPQEVPRLMNDLVNWLNNHIDPPKRKKHKYDLHPLLIACGFHVSFIKIHPFGDGNGRMARILMNLILMLCGYVPAVIKLEKRKEYYSALNLSTLDQMEPLAEFVGLECIQSLEMAIKAAKGESIDEEDDLDKKLSLLKKEVEAEDDEKSIKTRLSKAVVQSAFENWGYSLLSQIATTTSKFNEFYDNPEHYISLTINSTGTWDRFESNPNFERLKEVFSRDDDTKEISSAEFRLQCSFGAYKKGGLNPFDCNYNIEIKFEKYQYEVLLRLFDDTSKKSVVKPFKKNLLHTALTKDEIKDIDKQWGESLYMHLDYNRNKIKENENL